MESKKSKIKIQKDKAKMQSSRFLSLRGGTTKQSQSSDRSLRIASFLAMTCSRLLPFDQQFLVRRSFSEGE